MREKKGRKEKGKERKGREKKEKGEVYPKKDELLSAIAIKIFLLWGIEFENR